MKEPDFNTTSSNVTISLTNTTRDPKQLINRTNLKEHEANYKSFTKTPNATAKTHENIKMNFSPVDDFLDRSLAIFNRQKKSDPKIEKRFHDFEESRGKNRLQKGR